MVLSDYKYIFHLSASLERQVATTIPSEPSEKSATLGVFLHATAKLCIGFFPDSVKLAIVVSKLSKFAIYVIELLKIARAF